MGDDAEDAQPVGPVPDVHQDGAPGHEARAPGEADGVRPAFRRGGDGPDAELANLLSPGRMRPFKQHEGGGCGLTKPQPILFLRIAKHGRIGCADAGQPLEALGVLAEVRRPVADQPGLGLGGGARQELAPEIGRSGEVAVLQGEDEVVIEGEDAGLDPVRADVGGRLAKPALGRQHGRGHRADPLQAGRQVLAHALVERARRLALLGYEHRPVFSRSPWRMRLTLGSIW